MSEREISHLLRCAAVGLTLWWRNNAGTYHKVLRIGFVEDEPGPCAFFEPRGEGKYAALSSSAPEDFEITSPNMGFTMMPKAQRDRTEDGNV